MQRMAIIVAAGLACGAALAGPKDPASVGSSQKKVSVKAPPGANPEVLGWIDTFDTYTTGSGLNGQGGWVGWYGTGAQGFLVSSPAAHSSPNSLEYNINFNDCVQQLGYQNNVFVYRCWVYVDSAAFGIGYVIGLNDYQHTGLSAQWSMQTKFDYFGTGTVSQDAAGWTSAPTLPIVFDQWVEFFAIIDLVDDSYRDYYGGQLLSGTMPTGEPLTWTGAPDPITGGQTNALIDPLAPEFAVFAANDLYSDGIDLMYIDEPQLICYADMDLTTGPGNLDIFDFLAFQNRFVQNDILACDCDRSTGPGTCDIFDFLCFQNRFVAGCN